MIYRFKLVVIFLLFCLSANAQVITEISSQNDDRIDEWIIYTDDEDLEGSISLKWPLENNFNEWVYELGEYAGSIAMKWENNPDLWELKSSQGESFLIRTAWSGDHSEWIFKKDNTQYRLKSKFGANGLEWLVKTSNKEVYNLYMAEDRNPLIWLVDDHLITESLDLVIALSFIAIRHSLK